MDPILSISTKLSTPLMLAGFVAAAFFLIARIILQKNIFPKLTNSVSASLLRHVIDRFFWLALIGMMLGFFGFVIGRFPQASADQPDIQKPTSTNSTTAPSVTNGCNENKVISIGGIYKCGGQ